MSTTFDSYFDSASDRSRRGVRSIFLTIVDAVRRRSRIARDRRALHELPDYMLRDLGIDRSEIDLVVKHGRHNRMPLHPY